MTTRIGTLIHKSKSRILRLAQLSTLTVAATLLAAGDTATNDSEQAHAGHEKAAPAKLVQLVRDATRQFSNVNGATAAGYQPFLIESSATILFWCICL